MPCTDHETCEYANENQFQIYKIANHQSHKNDTETCSPFCVCACCGQTCHFEKTQFTIQQIAPTYNSVATFCTPTFVDDVLKSIWQPPKI